MLKGGGPANPFIDDSAAVDHGVGVSDDEGSNSSQASSMADFIDDSFLQDSHYQRPFYDPNDPVYQCLQAAKAARNKPPVSLSTQCHVNPDKRKLQRDRKAKSRAATTEQQKIALKAKDREKRAAQSDHERSLQTAKRNSRRNQMTQEEKDVVNSQARDKRAAQSDQERSNESLKRNNRRNSMTQSERDAANLARRQKLANESEEAKKARLLKRRLSRKKPRCQEQQSSSNQNKIKATLRHSTSPSSIVSPNRFRVLSNSPTCHTSPTKKVPLSGCQLNRKLVYSPDTKYVYLPSTVYQHTECPSKIGLTVVDTHVDSTTIKGQQCCMNIPSSSASPIIELTNGRINELNSHHSVQLQNIFKLLGDTITNIDSKWRPDLYPYGAKLLDNIEKQCIENCTFCSDLLIECPFRTNTTAILHNKPCSKSTSSTANHSSNSITPIGNIQDSSYHSSMIPQPTDLSRSLTCPQPRIDCITESKKFDGAVHKFHTLMSEYPEYACCKCEKLYFREGVVQIKEGLNFKLKLPKETKVWICNRCKKYQRNDKISPIDVKEMLLGCGELPDHLRPNTTECRLVSQTIPFMKIVSLPAGGQSCVKGPVVNVPIQPDKTCMQLPRKLSDAGIVGVQIKRKLDYKSVVMSDVVNPDKCWSLLVWLKENNPFYRNVVLSDEFIRDNYQGSNKQLFDTYMKDDPTVVAMSIIDLVLSNVTNEGTYCDLPFDTCIQKSDPAENITDSDGKIPFMDFAPGQESRPIPFLGNPASEPTSFPDLFPLGKGHFYCSDRLRLIKDKLLPKLSLKDYAESKLYSKNRKFAQNYEYVFYLQNWIERDELLNCISTHLRKGAKTIDGQIVTAGLLRAYQYNMDQLQNCIDAYKFMKNMKGTPAYLQKIKNDGIAMVNQLGCFTWFITCSFNDLVYSVPAILKLMGETPTPELLSDISWFKKHELVRLDPVIAVRMFDRYVRKILSYLIEDQAVLGEAEAHFGRDEFGGRGSPHLHMLLKVIGAPTLDKNSVEEVIAFVDKYVTTRIPSVEEDPDLHNLVTTLQRHSHTKTCQQAGQDKCRFGYPKTVSPVTRIVLKVQGKDRKTDLTDLEEKDPPKVHKESGPKSSRYRDIIYARELGAENINTYNPALLKATRSNIDVQFCTSMWDVVNYIISYATKKEKEVCDALKDIVKNIDQPVNKNSKDALRSLGNTFLNARSVSIQEAIFRCLPSLSLSHFKPSVIFIPSDMPNDRHGIVKPRALLQQLNDDSEDVFHTSLLDRYLQRPDSLNDMCCAEFASLYVRLDRPVTTKNAHKVITIKNNLGKMIRRDRPQIVRSHKKSRTKEPEKYCYSKLYLYLPWREEADLIGGFKSYRDSFVANIDNIKHNIIKFEQFDDDTLNKMEREIREEIRDSMSTEPKKETLDGKHLFNHPFEDTNINKEEEASNFNITYKEPSIDNEKYQEMVQNLNKEQKQLFDIIDEHSTRVSKGQKVNQLIHFLSGAGGVGKTYLINCLRHCISRKFKDSIINPRVAVAASTGVAAALIDGQTVHTLLQLDCQEGGRINPKPLSAKKKLQMRRFFQNIRYIFIDEVSMIGNSNINQINSRLNEIFGVPSDSSKFGGINIIFCGDLHQIPPVLQTLPFETKGIAALGHNIWKESVTFTELTQIVRSKDDKDFTGICHRLRVGKHSKEDVTVLKNRIVDKKPMPHEIMDSMVIYPTNKQCAKHNDDCINELRKTSLVTTITATDRFANEAFNRSIPSLCTGVTYDKMSKKPQEYTTDDVNKTAGLPTSLQLAPGARVMVRVNIDTPDKLVNGVIGTVHSIDLKVHAKIKDGQCTARDIRQVNVLFDDRNVGKSIQHRCDRYCSKSCNKTGTVPIKAVEKEFLSKKNNRTWLKRYQLPLVLSWACTVHKVQGLTLDKAFIYMARASKGHSWNPGMAYTAISRLTSLAELYFIAFDETQIRTSQKVIQEYIRLREISSFVVYPNVESIPASPKIKFVCPISSSLPFSESGTRSSRQFCKSPIILDQLGCPRSPNKSTFSPSSELIKNLKRNIPFSPLTDSAKKQFKTGKLFSPISYVLNKRSVSYSPSLNSPYSPLNTAKRTKSYISPHGDVVMSPLVCSASDVSLQVQHNPTSFPNVVQELVGRAYVIDFLQHPQSMQTATLLQSLGFSVNTSFANIQVNSSCGYIAARIISKLKSLIRDGQSWFNVPFDDCNYSGPSSFNTDICALGNYALNIRGSTPIFLTETNCLDLIPIYSLHFHNHILDSREQYLTDVECHSKSTFKGRIIHLWDKFKSSSQTFPLTSFIVNTHDEQGLHWYTVILEMSTPSTTSHEL